ncbi:hypothetical protein ABID22_000672 [Pontibacter aydingkolensis]|uniref:Uncharacterized protein n=1 Tax=Pontibacter aydingkolensis TaxID=1911536 RepID=A0ABS7CRJ0_9BACT|nr:hypothetical protein [Pontibacter aydingkolensis]MBW7466454.1 hypothetical protein [Pontibacter aydingkolensis]
MNVKIPAPHDCNGISLSLADVIRIEKRSLSFFESCAHNLYIVVRQHHNQEVFSLFCYKNQVDMLLAYDTISSLLKKASPEDVTLEMEPMPA